MVKKTLKLNIQPQLKSKVIRELLRVSRDTKEGKNLSPGFTNVEGVIAYLKKLK
ncbi:MAG: hypothetical protein NTV02_03415 [Candidatus Zambryskibacteria bacterium]|nr:hypothetical protein [Candidatus Zambryskibacteria bacterium]